MSGLLVAAGKTLFFSFCSSLRQNFGLLLQLLTFISFLFYPEKDFSRSGKKFETLKHASLFMPRCLLSNV
jgi:hypothetical protein